MENYRIENRRWTDERKTWPQNENKIEEMDWLPSAMYFVFEKTKLTHTIAKFYHGYDK